jgi:hypothetical protein
VRHTPNRLTTLVVAAAMAAIGCTARPSLERLTAARQLAADLLVQFTKAVDAANRAVLADNQELDGEVLELAVQNTNLKATGTR